MNEQPTKIDFLTFLSASRETKRKNGWETESSNHAKPNVKTAKPKDRKIDGFVAGRNFLELNPADVENLAGNRVPCLCFWPDNRAENKSRPQAGPRRDPDQPTENGRNREQTPSTSRES
jgi:hypothetical protein